MKQIIKRMALDAVAAVTARHPVLLPAAAAENGATLDVVAPYRVDNGILRLEVRQHGTGVLCVTMLEYDGYAPIRQVWQPAPIRYGGPTTLEFDLDRRTLRAGGLPCNGAPPLSIPRRFCLRLELQTDQGAICSRMSGHYRAVHGNLASADYFAGNNYVDYEAESEAVTTALLGLVKAYPIVGTALEIGCATGSTLQALARVGIRGVGVDFSEWAATRARARVGEDAVFVADVDREPLPEGLVKQAPFGALILLSLLEHLADPFAVLSRLDRLTAPGARLFIMTTNADSLCHSLFGRDWEGYFDWTHRGVDQVTVGSLRRWLHELGWRIEKLETTMIWSGNVDPMHATLRDWWAADRRFRRLLEEKELGDLTTCVATKAPAACRAEDEHLRGEASASVRAGGGPQRQ